MDPFVVACAVALGLWPLWAAVGSAGLGAWRGVLVAVAGGLTAATFWVAVATPRASADPEPPPDRPVEVHGDGSDFVSSDTCRGCHPREDASWRASHHRRMTEAAGPATVIPEIDSLEFDHRGGRLRLERRGDRYFAGIAQRGPGGAVDWVEREVVQTTGSHHFQAYWFATGFGRELTMFPFCYRVDEQRWMPVDAAFLMPPDTVQPLGGARWNTNCVNCHTTQGQPRVHDGSVDTHVAELGIACEACHGPARAHLDANRDPLRRYRLHVDGGPDPTIANPARMTPEREAEVCGQCHGVTLARQDLQDEWARDGFAYRPGERLLDTRILVEPAARDAAELRPTLARQPDFFDTIFWRDGQVRISGRDYHGLLASPCHAEGEGDRKMTCLSCHTMHAGPEQSLAEWADDQLAPGMRGDLGCVQCHGEYRDPAALRAHTRHEPDSVSCYDCHMPYTTFGLLKAIRSHTVTSPSVRETVEVGRPNACNLCHLDRTLGWTAAELDAGWDGDGRRTNGAVELTADEREVAAGALWALKGDAGVRALAAAAFGRDAARSASGSDWMAPYVAELARDPYHAVRFVAWQALREDAPAAGRSYDFMAPEAERERVLGGYLDGWRSRRADRAARDLARVLVDGDGELRVEAFHRLLAARDRRRVYLGE